MRKEIAKLKPSRVWHYFLEITKIPRKSKNEEKILQYLTGFAQSHNLEYEQDKTGNLVIRKPASSGSSSQRIVVLQSHVDMVCEKNEGVDVNFDTDPIEPYLEDGWVKARGTTLGADDGIGMATQLALLESADITHPALECLFTVDEETGLTGAFGLDTNFLKGDILLNLDSEDDGQLFIGCAGGIDTRIKLPFQKKNVPENHQAFRLRIYGLRGGHSGDDIHKGYGNANKILARVLWESTDKFDIRFSDFDAGSAHNAIAREGAAIVWVSEKNISRFGKYIAKMEKTIQKELHVTEPNVKVTTEKTTSPGFVVDKQAHNKLLNALHACPHGVIAWSQDIENFVETSTNLALVKTKKDHFHILNSHRSSVESAKNNAKNMVAATFRLAGAEIEHGDGYPGWAPNPDSEIVKLTAQSYEGLFKEKPQVLAIHAGLECGLIGEKYAGMDMISIGPEITGAHSPDEAIEVKSVEKFWDLTLEVLQRIE